MFSDRSTRPMHSERKPDTVAGLGGLAAAIRIGCARNSWLCTQHRRRTFLAKSNVVFGDARYAHPDVFCLVQHRSALAFVLVASLRFCLRFGCVCSCALSVCFVSCCHGTKNAAGPLKKYRFTFFLPSMGPEVFFGQKMVFLGGLD